MPFFLLFFVAGLSVVILLFLLVIHLLMPGLWRWVWARGCGIASWLLAPFRSWTGMDKPRGPKP